MLIAPRPAMKRELGASGAHARVRQISGQTTTRQTTTQPNEISQTGMKKALDQLIEETNLTVDEIADRAKLPAQRVSAMLDGRWTPSPSDRQKMAAVFGLTPEDVVWGHTMDPRNVRYRQFGLDGDL